MDNHSSTKAPRVFPILLTLIATPMILGGLQLVFLGGSFYYLLAGLLLLASARRLWEANPMGSLIYGGMLLATIAWALFESGTNLWALAPRILPFAGLGVWFLLPWLRNSLHDGKPPPLFSSDIAKGTALVGILGTVFVIISGSGYEVNPLSERSGINTVNTRTDWPSYGNTLGGSRYSPLDQINADTVANLEVAWTYRTGVGEPSRRRRCKLASCYTFAPVAM